MSRQITLDIPEEVVERAERIARLSHRNIGDVLTTALAVALPPMPLPEDAADIRRLPDDDLLKLCRLEMAEEDDRRLSELLELNSEGDLSETDRKQFVSLMAAYEAGLLLKASALAEAVRRGLRPPFQPPV